MGRLMRIAPAATAIGWQTPAGQVLRRMCSSSSGPEVSHPARERKGRQALVVAQRGGDDVGRQVGQQRPVGRAAAGRRRRGRRSRPAGGSRSGTGSSCRTPRRHRTGSAAGPGPRCTPGRRRRRRTRSRCGRRPRAAASKSYGVSSRSGGQQAARRPADEEGLDRSGRPAARRRAPTMSRSGVPSGTSAMPSPAGVRTWTRIVPGLVGGAGRRERVGAVADDPAERRRGSGRCGRRSACRTGRARPDAAGAARAGRACPRGPSAGPSPRPACRRPGPAGR